MFQDELTEVYGLGACPACTPGQLEGGEGGVKMSNNPPNLTLQDNILDSISGNIVQT